jgi:hypothetical protein
MPCFVIDNRALKNHKQVVVFENLRTCKRLLGARCFPAYRNRYHFTERNFYVFKINLASTATELSLLSPDKNGFKSNDSFGGNRPIAATGAESYL